MTNYRMFYIFNRLLAFLNSGLSLYFISFHCLDFIIFTSNINKNSSGNFAAAIMYLLYLLRLLSVISRSKR